jgi:hypothetical protein
MTIDMQIPKFQGCIGFIDGILIKIRKPWNNVVPWVMVQWVEKDVFYE